MFGASRLTNQIRSVVTSASFVGAGSKSGTNLAQATMNYPSGTQIGDIAVLVEFQYGDADTTSIANEYINPGWQKVFSKFDGPVIPTNEQYRFTVSYKLLTSFDNLTSITGLQGITNHNILLVFRPNDVALGVNNYLSNSILSNGDPSSITINMEGARGVLIAIACYGSLGNPVDPRTSSVFMTETQSFTTALYTKHNIYNSSDSRTSISIDMQDEGNFNNDDMNGLAGFYLRII